MDETGFDTINVIPLVDVMLVLLTIVLTTSTFIAVGAIPVNLPKSSSASASQATTTNIALDRQGVIFLDREMISLAGLRQLLTERDKNGSVLIRADKAVRLQSFVDVMDVVKGLDFTNVSLQTEANP